MIEYQFWIYIKSLRHFLLNRQRPVSQILFRHRKHNIFLILQIVKVIVRYTTIFPTKNYFIGHFKCGIAASDNQLNELLGDNLRTVYLFGKTKRSFKDTDVIQVKVNTFCYIFHVCIILMKLSNTRFIIYADLISLMHCYNSKLKVAIGHKENIYVSNLNSPLIINCILNNHVFDRVIHIPHAILGSSCLPDLRLCIKYFCWGNFERLKFSKTDKIHVRGSNRRLSGFKRSHIGGANIVLPKDLTKVDRSRLPKEYLLLKFHPGTNIMDRFKFQVALWWIGLRFEIVSHLDPKYKVYSVSTTAILDIIESGKCVHLLPSNELDDHYKMSEYLIKDGFESAKRYERQIEQFSVYDDTFRKYLLAENVVII